MKNQLEKLMEELSELPKRPAKVKLNVTWLKEQIVIGSIRKEDYGKGDMNFLIGIPVEISEETETYEFTYD